MPRQSYTAIMNEVFGRLDILNVKLNASFKEDDMFHKDIREILESLDSRVSWLNRRQNVIFTAVIVSIAVGIINLLL